MEVEWLKLVLQEMMLQELTSLQLSGDQKCKELWLELIKSSKLNYNKEAFVGIEAIEKKSVLNLNYPIEHGVV